MKKRLLALVLSVAMMISVIAVGIIQPAAEEATVDYVYTYQMTAASKLTSLEMYVTYDESVYDFKNVRFVNQKIESLYTNPVISQENIDADNPYTENQPITPGLIALNFSSDRPATGLDFTAGADVIVLTLTAPADATPVKPEAAVVIAADVSQSTSNLAYNYATVFNGLTEEGSVEAGHRDTKPDKANIHPTEAPTTIDTVSDGYYLVGQFDGKSYWDATDLADSLKFAANEHAEGEYMISHTFAVGDKVKIAKVENNAITTWYLDGMDNEYQITAAGDYTVYFRPAGNDDWSGADGGYSNIAFFAKAEAPTQAPTLEPTVEPTEAPKEALLEDHVLLVSDTVVYNGKVRTPAVRVYNAARQKLVENTDYTVVVPEGRTEPGTYTYTITGIGNYTGTVQKVFTIKPASTEALSADNVELYSATVVYNGKVRTPAVRVYNAAGEKLVENTDYTVVVPEGRTEPGTYTYTITGIGNYSGTVEKIFTIRATAPEALKADRISLYSETVIYNGKVRNPVVRVYNAAGERLVENTDYTVVVPEGRTEPGTYTYTITGIGDYIGTVRKVFTIKASETEALSADKITLYSETVIYNGKVRNPVVKVYNAAGERLVENTDYTVVVPEGRTEPGTYTYTITGIGDYTGTVQKIFTIRASATEALKAENIELYSATVVYNGKVRTPSVRVYNEAGDRLTLNKDYTVVVPEGRTEIGEYIYTITGIGDYSGTVEKVFTIKGPSETLSAENIELYSATVIYNGKVRNPVVRVFNAAGDRLVENTDYTVVVPEGRTEPGEYTYTITGIGNYSGTIQKVFTIVKKG